MSKLVNIPCLVFWLRSICVSKYMIPQISSALPGQLVSTLESKHYFSDIKSLPISRVKLVTSFVILYDHMIHMPTWSVSMLFMVSEMQGRRSLWSRNSLTKCGINPYVLRMTQFVVSYLGPLPDICPHLKVQTIEKRWNFEFIQFSVFWWPPGDGSLLLYLVFWNRRLLMSSAYTWPWRRFLFNNYSILSIASLINAAYHTLATHKLHF